MPVLAGLGTEFDPVNVANGPDAHIWEMVDIMRAAPINPLRLIRVSMLFGRYSLKAGQYDERLTRCQKIAAEAARRGITAISVIGDGPALNPGPTIKDASFSALGNWTAYLSYYNTNGQISYGLIPTGAYATMLNTYYSWIDTANAEYARAGYDPNTSHILEIGNETKVNAWTVDDHEFFDYMIPAIRARYPNQTIIGPGCYGGWGEISSSVASETTSLNTHVDSQFGIGVGATGRSGTSTSTGAAWRACVNGYSIHRYCNAPYLSPTEYASRFRQVLDLLVARFRLYTALPLYLTEYGVSPADCGMATTVTKPLNYDLLNKYRRHTIEAALSCQGLAGAVFFDAMDSGNQHGLCNFTGTGYANDKYFNGAGRVFNAFGLSAYDSNPPSGTYLLATNETTGSAA